MKPELQSRVEQEVVNGQFWRAKELLHSTFPEDFDPDFCEAYGQVLLQMSDFYEAGRYLFVSGARNPEYKTAIQIFIDRFSKLHVKGRYSVLPGRIHRVPIEDWPDALLEDLRILDAFEDIEKYHQSLLPNPASRRFMDLLIPFGCITIMVLMLLLAGFGLLTLLSMLL